MALFRILPALVEEAPRVGRWNGRRSDRSHAQAL